jgi:hypothetical protein
MTISHTQYDPFNSDYNTSGSQKEFWAYLEEQGPNYEVIQKWLKCDIENKIQASRGRIDIFRRNLAMYKGIQYRSYESRDNIRDDNLSLRNPRMCINYIYDMVEQKVAQRARNKPGIAFIPHNNEWKDIINSKTAKMLCDFKATELDLTGKFSACDKISFLQGTTFLMIDWDRFAGKVHPQSQDGSVMVGDVMCRAWRPDELFLQLGKRSYDQVNEFTTVEYSTVDELKKLYPNVANDISESDKSVFDYESFEEKQISGSCVKYTYWHKPTKMFADGCKIEFTDNVILSWVVFPFDDKELPIEILTDIDVIGELYGRPFVNNIVQAQRHHNLITSAIARNHGVASAPKWVVPKGACSINNLSNDITVVEYAGPRAPELRQSNPTGQEIFIYQDKLEQFIGRLSGIYAISRGDVPPRISAASALMFLDEQEQQRESQAISKRNRFIRNVYTKILSRMKQFYRPEDGRMARILGKDNEYMVKAFSNDFEFNCSVTIQNTSALPDSKAGRIQAIVDLNQATATDPIFKKEEVIQLLDLGADETFKDEATVAVKAAESILNDIIEGQTNPPEPQPYDDLLVHYGVFMRALQSRSFKETLPSDVQQKLIDRITTIEMLMWDRSLKNQTFMMKLQMLDNYPIFFAADKYAEMMAIKSGMMQQMAQAPIPSVGPETKNIKSGEMAGQTLQQDKQAEQMVNV